MHIYIFINGAKMLIPESIVTFLNKELNYSHLCRMVNMDEKYCPTVTYSCPCGRDGTLTSGEFIEMEDGCIFNVSVTSNS